MTEYRLAILDDYQQVSGDYAVWDRCAHHVCNVFRYQISTGQTTKIPNTLTGKMQYYPSVTSTGVVYFAHSGDGCGRHVKLIEWVAGQPLNILVEFGPGRDLASTTQTVPDQVAGTDVYFDKYSCRTAAGDIYKIVVPWRRAYQVPLFGEAASPDRGSTTARMPPQFEVGDRGRVTLTGSSPHRHRTVALRHRTRSPWHGTWPR